MAGKPYKRRFNYTEGRSNKFWEVEVIGKTFISRWGRIGTDGQAQSEEYPSNDAAVRAAAKKCMSKLKKGYVEGQPGVQVVVRPVAGDIPRSRMETKATEAISRFFDERPAAARRNKPVAPSTSRRTKLPNQAPKRKPKPKPAAKTTTPQPVPVSALAPRLMRKVRI